MTDCRNCKKHYTQSGNCWENKRNCLFFDEEPRGKMIRTTVTFELNSHAETKLIKHGNIFVAVDNNGQEIEMRIIKINWVHMGYMTCNVDVEYHENEMPAFEKKRKFKIVK